MERTKWIDRKFHFDFQEGCLPNIIERLRGTELRLIALTSSVPDEYLLKAFDAQWTIQQHIGHLADLEELHCGRIHDFILRKEILRAADMSNAKTNLADHNNKSLSYLLNDFSEKRNNFILLLEKLDDVTQGFYSVHPRLQVKMRPVDLAFFTSEHDDHHITTIRELLNKNKEGHLK